MYKGSASTIGWRCFGLSTNTEISADLIRAFIYNVQSELRRKTKKLRWESKNYALEGILTERGRSLKRQIYIGLDNYPP